MTRRVAPRGDIGVVGLGWIGMGMDHTDTATALPETLPESDRVRWDAMTIAQRVRARARLDAIVAWRAGGIPLDRALEMSGLSRTRFYTVAADFRAAGTLASLGAFAGAGAARQRLDPEAVNALQAVVADVVAMNRGASVSELVRLMVEASGVDEASLPGSTRLRGIVEAEIRRADANEQPGHSVKLDYTAINLPRSDGRPHIMFTLIDKGTRLVLGAWVGAAPDAGEGYRGAARDASARIAGDLASITWADRMVAIEMTVGDDRDAAADLRTRLVDGGVRANVQVAPGRFGRYFRRLVGERMGRIGITPLRTVDGAAVPDNGDMTPWSDEAAAAAVALAIDAHNADVMAERDLTTGRRVMPDDLARALDVLAG